LTIGEDTDKKEKYKEEIQLEEMNEEEKDRNMYKKRTEREENNLI
jgi:hypothetical protein